MSLNSMTGFARVEGNHIGTNWYWELRSVNGRGLDIRIRLPQGLDALEPVIRSGIADKLARGNINATLTLQRDTPATTIRVNETLLAQVAAAAQQIQDQTNCGPPTAEGIMQQRGVLELIDAPADPAEEEALQSKLEQTLLAAIEALASARQQEGARLTAVLTKQIDEIEELVGIVASSPARKPDAIRERLGKQVALLMETGQKFDEARLHQEAALLATRADVAEELDRLDTHISAARELLNTPGAVGRKFDFLAQEFNREANTLCSKSNDEQVTKAGLALKVVIDQLREQVQNIE